MLKVVDRLILEIFKGSRKISSSNKGNNNETFNKLNKVGLKSFWAGNRSKYCNGAEIPKPMIMSIARRMRNDFQISLKNEEKEIMFNWFPLLGCFKNWIKSLISIIIKEK